MCVHSLLFGKSQQKRIELVTGPDNDRSVTGSPTAPTLPTRALDAITTTVSTVRGSPSSVPQGASRPRWAPSAPAPTGWSSKTSSSARTLTSALRSWGPAARTAPTTRALTTAHAWTATFWTGLAINSIFYFLFVKKTIDFPGGQINDPLSGKYSSFQLLCLCLRTLMGFLS